MTTYTLHCFKESGNSYKVALALTFTANLASYRWLRTFASPAPDESVLTYMRGRAAGAVDILERHLQARSFVVGERLTIADVSMAGYVFYPKEELDFDFLADYPNIAAWMARLSQTPGWKAPYELLA